MTTAGLKVYRQSEVPVDTDLFGLKAQYKIWCADGKVAGQILKPTARQVQW